MGNACSPLSPVVSGVFVDRLTPTYRGPAIYFGGSFSSIFQEWSDWLLKFEDLLRQPVLWEHAVVVLVTEWMGQHVYWWTAKIDNFDAEKPTPITEWTFEGGPRDFR